jgi:hypothetical protein
MAVATDKKPPVFTPRDMEVLRNADRVVARVWVAGEGWREQQYFSESGENVAQLLTKCQLARQIVEERFGARRRIMLLIGGVVNGELGLAPAEGRDP